jgi:hypothetical protein
MEISIRIPCTAECRRHVSCIWMIQMSNAFELGLYSQTLKKGFSIVYDPNPSVLYD